MSIATLRWFLAAEALHCGRSARSREKTTSLVVHTLSLLIPARRNTSVESASRQVHPFASEYTYFTSIRGRGRFRLSAPMHVTRGFFPDIQFTNKNSELHPTGHPRDVSSAIWPPPTTRRAFRKTFRKAGMEPEITSICQASY